MCPAVPIAVEFARAYRQPCYRIRALYTLTPSPDQEDSLRNASPSVHDGLESVVFFTLGMIVLLYSNISTPQGVTNGSYGTIVGFRFAEVDGDGASSCISERGLYRVFMI